MFLIIILTIPLLGALREQKAGLFIPQYAYMQLDMDIIAKISPAERAFGLKTRGFGEIPKKNPENDPRKSEIPPLGGVLEEVWRRVTGLRPEMAGIWGVATEKQKPP